jgi:hypothetical protein
MRNANAQRKDTMIRVEALQQPQKPHVRHAEIGGCFTRAKSGDDGCVGWRTMEVGRT